MLGEDQGNVVLQLKAFLQTVWSGDSSVFAGLLLGLLGQGAQGAVRVRDWLGVNQGIS